MADVLTIHISGQRFAIPKCVLSKFPDSKLGRAAATDQTEVTYQRPTAVFKCVLAYYQTGHLHVPMDVCLGSVQEELDFWGFAIDDLESCCKRKVKKFHAEQEEFVRFENAFSDKCNDAPCCHLPESRVTKWRRFLWLILDKPFSSIPAKVYFIISSLIVTLSVLIVFLATMDVFTEKMTFEDWKEYYGRRFHAFEDRIRVMSGLTASGQMNATLREFLGNFTLPANVYVSNEVFENIQTFCTVYFTVELLLKFLCCPNRLLFLKSPLNIIDIMAVLVSLLNLIVEYASAEERYTSTAVDVLCGLQVFRVLRLLRLTKNITGARVLAFAVSSSYKEICFMILLVGINTVLFGTLAYSVNHEIMKDLPLASWWALITMTSVGYGDVVPSNHEGKFIGALCACMGIMILALTMPLFVDNFLTFYSYGHEICQEQAARDSRKTSVKTSKKESKECDRVVSWTDG